MMTPNEIDIRMNEVFAPLYEEALHKGAEYVEALEVQRKRQLTTETEQH